ncbi:MAG TPA: hypothetical protein VJ251_20655, partial [Stellaceae bacterium]|nr:hypothetical protein [Stellaceae bacterium]
EQPADLAGTLAEAPFLDGTHFHVREFGFESGCGRETDCLLEGDGFEPSVPHKKTTLFGCPRSVPQFAFRNKNRLFRAGTDGSNLPSSSGESSANLISST